MSVILYVWPGRWDLPSIDPGCLATILYLQATIPGKYSIQESINPDLSPTGNLPYITYENQIVASLPSITQFVQETFGRSLDSSLTTSRKSQSAAWLAHADSHLGDLVSHMCFARWKNWAEVLHPAFATMYSIPQRYFVPNRIRKQHRHRLEASGLWDLKDPEPKEKQSLKERAQNQGQGSVQSETHKKDTFKRAFESEKVNAKARPVFEIYSRLLHGQTYLLSETQISTLDIIVAAHILVLLGIPFLDPLLPDLLKQETPNIIAHAELIQSQLLPSLPQRQPPASPVLSLLPSTPAVKEIAPVVALGLIISGVCAHLLVTS